jgi:hypothetical protein
MLTVADYGLQADHADASDPVVIREIASAI